MPVNESNIHNISKVYISNAAVDIWELLNKNSVLFEMYMDDIWLDNSNRSANKKNFRGFDLDNFSIALFYLNILVNKEIQIRNHAKNLGTFEKYTELFGKDSICEHLLVGLTNSLNAFYKKDAPEESLTNQIETLTKIIRAM